MVFELTGRVALVTGAGAETGIGYATARLLASAGAHVLLTSTTERVHERAATLQAAGHRASSFVADLTVADQVTGLVSAGVAAAGRIDVLVNNAGMTSVQAPGESGNWRSTGLDVWRASIERNLTTAFDVTRAVLGPMTASGWGRVVNVASVTGPLVAYPGDVAYAAAKAGMAGLTRALAVEVGSRGVTVNAVLPGWIDTGSATDDERAAGLASPVGRPGRPEEVAAAVLFLASAEASYVTGTLLVVDGGNSVQEMKG